METKSMSATLIDVREYPEFAVGHIAGSKLVPLASLSSESKAWNPDEPLTLVCKSGKRSEDARQQLEARGFTSLSILIGGIDGWKAAGRPLVVDHSGPWSMERQVRVAAGSLVLIFMALAWAFSPLFLIGPAFIGAGLLFAGVSNTCMMGSVLAMLPWNQRKGSVA